METRIKYFSETEYMKDYPSYAIDTEGNVWSLKFNKRKILSPGFKRGNLEKFVRLTSKYGRIKNFSIHRLVALCFIPTDNTRQLVVHKNGNVNDNRLENLEWKDTNRKIKQFDGYVVDKMIASRIKQVHSASIRKGMKVSDLNTFFNTIIQDALEQHVSQYGLRRLLIDE